MEQLQQTPKVFQLPLFEILHKAVQKISSLRHPILLALSGPFIATLVFAVAYRLQLIPSGPFIEWLGSVISIVFCSFAAVTCHRLALIGPGSIRKFGVVGLDKREWRYFLQVFAIAILLMIALSPLGVLGAAIDGATTTQDAGILSWPKVANWLIKAACYLLYAIVFAQLSLTLPAIAVDERLDVGDAFGLAAGNRWRLSALIFGVPLLCQSLIRLIEYFSSGMVALILNVCLEWVLLPFVVILLSLSYKCLREIERSMVDELNVQPLLNQRS